jgi:arylamine N-acetyltransferase
MKTPQVHALNIITIEGREYLADTGYPAPLLEPIPRDLATDYETTLGRDRYVLKPQDANAVRALNCIVMEFCATAIWRTRPPERLKISVK